MVPVVSGTDGIVTRGARTLASCCLWRRVQEANFPGQFALKVCSSKGDESSVAGELSAAHANEYSIRRSLRSVCYKMGLQNVLSSLVEGCRVAEGQQ